MKLKIEKDKFPLIEFEDNKFTHLFPVTKYQFERYIWENPELNINYDEMLKGSPRISPHEVNKKNFKNLFITNISFNEASEFAKWIGGRLPTEYELAKISGFLNKLSIETIIQTIKYNKNSDKRCLDILNKLNELQILFNHLQIEEMCSDAFIPNEVNYKRNIFLWQVGEELTPLVGNDTSNIHGKFSFRIIKTMEDN